MGFSKLIYMGNFINWVNRKFLYIIYQLPGWLSGKESACNAIAAEDIYTRFLGQEDPLEGIWQPTGNPLQYSCLEHPMDREAWWATV